MATGTDTTSPARGTTATIPGVPPDIDSVRAQLPSLIPDAYLNTGGCGPLAAAAAEALAGAADRSLRRPRGSAEGFERTAAETQALREAVGRTIGAPDTEIALTANTTGGVNVAAWGIDWRSGDEIVVPALEHPGLSVPLAVIARRHGVTIRLIDPTGDAADLEEAVARVSGPRTRLVALSHVSWATGAVLDVAGAARAARAVGALVLVDGAQSAGAIPVDVGAMDVDAYAFPAHKWLLGPEGLGALWVSPAAMERLDLTASGYESGTDHALGGGVVVHPGARRHEVSTPPAALLPAWRASIEWLEELGWGWIHERVVAAQSAARAGLDGLPGVRLLTPPGRQAGLVTFTVAGREPEEACAALARRGVLARWLIRPPALRASLGFFSDDTDVTRLVEGVTAIGGGC